MVHDGLLTVKNVTESQIHFFEHICTPNLESGDQIWEDLVCLFDTSLSHGTCFASERVGLRRVGFVLGVAHTYLSSTYLRHRSE